MLFYCFLQGGGRKKVRLGFLLFYKRIAHQFESEVLMNVLVDSFVCIIGVIGCL